MQSLAAGRIRRFGLTVHGVKSRLTAVARLGLGVIIVLSGASAASGQAVLYVDVNATGPFHNGTSWCAAYTALQDALDHAAQAGSGVTTIRVADGVYTPDRGANQTPGDRWATFRLIDNVALRGGYAGCGAVDPNDREINGYETILSGDLNQDDVPVPCTQDSTDCYRYGRRCIDSFCIIKEDNNDNSFNVLVAANTAQTAELDGFTVTGARGRMGGGMYLYGGGSTLTRCTFVGNTATLGGGILVSDGDLLLIDCTFSRNSAVSVMALGGGINVGGSDSAVTLINCLFKNNTAGNLGGAMIVSSVQALTAVNCLFVANSANTGGAISTDYNGPMLINCTLVGNVATRAGGGVANFIHGTSTLTNCLLWGNRDLSGSGETAQLNNDPYFVNTFIVNNSLVQGWTGALGGVGNFGADPLFVDADGPDGMPGTEDDDLRLLEGSPCIDAGDSSALPNDLYDLDGDGDTLEPFPFDFDGTRRIAGAAVDIGAYEAVPATITVQLDIQPGHCPNKLNVGSQSPLRVAIVGTGELDVSGIIRESVYLIRADGSGGIAVPMRRPHRRGTPIQDVATPFEGEPCDCHRTRGDGIDDLVVEFSTRRVAEVLELGSLASGSVVSLTLQGVTQDGTNFVASDCVAVTGRRR